MTKFIELLEKHAVPAFIVLVGMWFTVDGLKRDVAELKRAMQLIADQQIEITRIHEQVDHIKYRLGKLEKQ